MNAFDFDEFDKDERTPARKSSAIRLQACDDGFVPLPLVPEAENDEPTVPYLQWVKSLSNGCAW